MLRVRNRQDSAATPCSHPISDAITSKLPNPKVCPACFIKQHTETIKDVQRRLVERGGVFASKDEHGHKSLRKELRDAKIGLTNAVAQFEIAVAEAQLPPADLSHLRNALLEWEDQKIRLAKIPGLVYVSGAEEDEPTEEDRELAKLMMELLAMVLKKELTPDEMEERAATTSTEANLDHQRPGSQAHVPKDRTSIPETSELCLAPSVGNLQDKAAPKSIFKRKIAFSSADSLTTSPVRKRVRTRNFAAVSPEALNTSNPFPFAKLSDNKTIQAHRPQTSAEQHRLRSDFHRGCPNYTPGVWASSAFTEKANTSLFKIPWNEAEEQMRKEQEEAAEERKIADRLKMVAQAWTGIWWAKEVMQHVDLEKIREAGSGTSPEAGSLA
ncbi:hypothetical protein P153DRAFT_294327 [Dothidotthia symphoricarpi CBS 119687]|uniref:Uncharacterized protein n=1 Tax=Dothidotthia symphoricarpi CBS 119687 TaxID=1392245 RepID=A0A6A6ABB6_9PLEO|nr:uncharacterized protein P153DRAFT_294327 [Dothidotthia symphoricarpi CBS 119687]KAF2128168.1 hypothetical protein P153DRAFT_294327 [Dothidotthia symphoricarpi CBS 119687]